MVQILQAETVDLRVLIEQFGLELVRNDQFFPECHTQLPEVTDDEKRLLDKVVDGFINLLNYPPLLEDVIRMSVVDPLLFLAEAVEASRHNLRFGVEMNTSEMRSAG